MVIDAAMYLPVPEIKIMSSLDLDFISAFSYIDPPFVYSSLLAFLPHNPWCLDGWPALLQEKVCLGCISETVRCRKFILVMDIG